MPTILLGPAECLWVLLPPRDRYASAGSQYLCYVVGRGHTLVFPVFLFVCLFFESGFPCLALVVLEPTVD